MGFVDKIKAQDQQAVESATRQTLDAVPSRSAAAPEANSTGTPWPTQAADGVNGLLLELTSHIEGKNAKVRAFNDRIGWEKPKSISVGKMTEEVVWVGERDGVAHAHRGHLDLRHVGTAARSSDRSC